MHDLEWAFGISVSSLYLTHLVRVLRGLQPGKGEAAKWSFYLL